MNKDYYFQHDYNPTTDAKIQAMLSVYGDWGYGLFWRMVEMMHREIDNSILLKKYVFSSFAQHKSTSVEQVEAFVKDCINEFELFASDGTRFWSERVKRNMDKRSEISVSRSKAGKASAEARKKSTRVKQVLTSVEQNPTKESKEKKSKEELFSRFYEAYQKKVDKPAAVKAWMKIDLDEMPGIIEKAKTYAMGITDKQFQPYPASWLNGRRWEDDEQPPPVNNNHPKILPDGRKAVYL